MYTAQVVLLCCSLVPDGPLPFFLPYNRPGILETSYSSITLGWNHLYNNNSLFPFAYNNNNNQSTKNQYAYCYNRNPMTEHTEVAKSSKLPSLTVEESPQIIHHYFCILKSGSITKFNKINEEKATAAHQTLPALHCSAGARSPTPSYFPLPPLPCPHLVLHVEHVAGVLVVAVVLWAMPPFGAAVDRFGRLVISGTIPTAAILVLPRDSLESAGMVVTTALCKIYK